LPPQGGTNPAETAALSGIAPQKRARERPSAEIFEIFIVSAQDRAAASTDARRGEGPGDWVALLEGEPHVRSEAAE